MKKKAISIVIPTWNEEGNIAPLVRRIHAALTPRDITYEIIFVDDLSTDATTEEIMKLREKYPVILQYKVGIKGKAQSLLEGFAHAKYPLICMIDADLQYPPEAIPYMIDKIGMKADIVVGDRVTQDVPFVRKFLSKSFLFIFGKFLHQLPVDVQSGLKVFRKAVLADLSLQPTPWTFDMDFLIKARLSGYKIVGHPISFYQRNTGKAKINLIRASIEVGLSALKLKFTTLPHRKNTPVSPTRSFSHKGKEFRSYSALPHHLTALENITGSQKRIIFGLIGILFASFLINWHTALMGLVTVLTTLYFADLFFNFFLIYRSFSRNPEIKISDREIALIPETSWPVYTVFCPLYKEWNVVPQFVRAMSQLDYPKDKLQVMLLLEEDDKETILQVSKMQLPSYFETVIVPHSHPKTKPKALNYGLMKARGEYVVIYDAEDVPDPLQLKKAILAFQKTKKETVCVQAKLNFYNPTQNILTRLFTAEYSLWFDLVLTGLQSIKAPIPLGGTSNHFKAKDLHILKGWDAFNVTEDCDLGTRLTKHGYYTAIFDSTTLEEANSDAKNWYHQRSRWIKGYIQTYLVHMRNPLSFLTSSKPLHLLTFQFIIGGKILSLFINPLMWCVTASYFLFRPYVGETIESLYLTPIFYMGVFSLIVGNFLYVYYYMVGCAKRGQEELIPYVFFVPLYWLGMSLASWKALYEVIYKPHHWSKTKHGLHLGATEAKSRLGPIPLPISPAFMK